jgi:hypothetical protein
VYSQSVPALISKNVGNSLTNYKTWGGILYNVKDTAYGAKGDGIADDSAAIQAAITAASASGGGVVFFPPGTYLASNVTGASNIVIEGAGRDLVFLKRKNSASGTLPIVEFNGKTKFEVRGITFDGNKANQTTGSNSLSIVNCGDYVIENNRMINAKAASGYGSGIAVVTGSNDTALTTSRVENNWVSDNDGDGFYLNQEWNVAVRGNTFKNNGGSGLNVLNNVFPPVADVSDGLMIVNNYVIGNTQNGITVSGYVTGGTSSAPIFGTSVPASRRIVIQGNVCTGNGAYGIAYQGTNGSVIGNVCELNSRLVGYSAGILFNAEASTCTGNVTRDNKAFGIDAGGSYFSLIANNSIQSEGVTDNVSATYLNLGASVGNIVIGNDIRMLGSSQHTGINYPGIDGDGNTPFPVVGAETVIKNNKICLNNSALSAGVIVNRLAGSAGITDNDLRVNTLTDQNRLIICEIQNCVIKGNTSSVNGSYITMVASAATTIIPDYAETIYVTGNTNITKIYTYSQSVYDGKVRDVSITNQGSGYSPSNRPTIAFSGGGGTGAAATAEVDNGGRVVGVTMTNNGSGYTSAPTVTISGGVGTGAAGTALIGLNNYEGREISVMFQGASLTVTDGGNLNLVGNLVTGANNTLLKLRGAYGNWYEVSRAIT